MVVFRASMKMAQAVRKNATLRRAQLIARVPGLHGSHALPLAEMAVLEVARTVFLSKLLMAVPVAPSRMELQVLMNVWTWTRVQSIASGLGPSTANVMHHAVLERRRRLLSLRHRLRKVVWIVFRRTAKRHRFHATHSTVPKIAKETGQSGKPVMPHAEVACSSSTSRFHLLQQTEVRLAIMNTATPTVAVRAAPTRAPLTAKAVGVSGTVGAVLAAVVDRQNERLPSQLKQPLVEKSVTLKTVMTSPEAATLKTAQLTAKATGVPGTVALRHAELDPRARPSE
jgi:hypothetical protein